MPNLDIIVSSNISYLSTRVSAPPENESCPHEQYNAYPFAHNTLYHSDRMRIVDGKGGQNLLTIIAFQYY